MELLGVGRGEWAVAINSQAGMSARKRKEGTPTL